MAITILLNFTSQAQYKSPEAKNADKGLVIAI